mmetsp:Transcript_22878/g.47583  ORF Transcript_22878/g.47583 Transcript_22878/m.47583 type:complete len:241 (+) Transcript_22878:846-1568(+)
MMKTNLIYAAAAWIASHVLLPSQQHVEALPSLRRSTGLKSLPQSPSSAFQSRTISESRSLAGDDCCYTAIKEQTTTCNDRTCETYYGGGCKGDDFQTGSTQLGCNMSTCRYEVECCPMSCLIGGDDDDDDDDDDDEPPKGDGKKIPKPSFVTSTHSDTTATFVVKTLIFVFCAFGCLFGIMKFVGNGPSAVIPDDNADNEDEKKKDDDELNGEQESSQVMGDTFEIGDEEQAAVDETTNE